MRQSRSNLNCELKDIKRATQDKNLTINYEKLILKQQQAIESLKQEILMLKSYISLDKVGIPFELNCSDISIGNTSTTLSQIQLRGDLEESAIDLSTKRYEKFYKNICQILQLTDSGNSDESLVFNAITSLKKIATQKQAPVFIERIKQIKVPYTIQKPVDRIVQKQVEKLVYVDRPVVIERFIQKPVFKEKIIERFVQRKQEQPHPEPKGLNKTYSEKNIRSKKNDQQYVYQTRYEEKSKYESFRKYQSGSTLMKKRVDNGKNYYRKDY